MEGCRRHTKAWRSTQLLLDSDRPNGSKVTSARCQRLPQERLVPRVVEGCTISAATQAAEAGRCCQQLSNVCLLPDAVKRIVLNLIKRLNVEEPRGLHVLLFGFHQIGTSETLSSVMELMEDSLSGGRAVVAVSIDVRNTSSGGRWWKRSCLSGCAVLCGRTLGAGLWGCDYHLGKRCPMLQTPSSS